MNDRDLWLPIGWSFGLIKASFVRPSRMHELQFASAPAAAGARATRHVQRIQKDAAESKIRLDSVITTSWARAGGESSRAMMIAGVRQPHKLDDLAGKQIKATPKELYDALHGR